MAAKINTPVFDESLTYDLYETEVWAWQEVTTLEKKKQALVLILALPEKKGEILENIGLDQLKTDEGVNTYLFKVFEGSLW